MIAALHDREPERLAALVNYKILYSDPEVAYNRIAELARKIFSVPVGLVSLLDETQEWFKAHPGFEFGSVGREHSFCAHAILTSKVMVVEDTRNDLRFQDNSLVEGIRGIRFYAAAPLLTAAGLPLGTMAILDYTPRVFNETQQVILQDLAHLVMDQMQMRLTGEALRTANEKLAHQATHDALTGLPNRAFFDRSLDVALTHAKRRKSGLAILYMDLDKFKQINDQFGHRTGDLLLQQVSERLLRATPKGATLARLGGDEFVLMLLDVSDRVSATLMAAKLAHVMEPPFPIEGLEIAVRASVGYCLYPDDADSARLLLHKADADMYRSKQTSGRYNSGDVNKRQARVNASVSAQSAG